MNIANCDLLPVQAVGGWWYRAVSPHHLPTSLATRHSKLFPTRFNPGPNSQPRPFETLYLGEDSIVCLQEIDALLPTNQGWISNHRLSACVLNIELGLARVVDLTDAASQQLIATTVQELTGQWRPYAAGNAPTQQLAAALFSRRGVQGLIYPSAKDPSKRNLVLFPEKLGRSGRVLHTDSRGQTHRLP